MLSDAAGSGAGGYLEVGGADSQTAAPDSQPAADIPAVSAPGISVRPVEGAYVNQAVVDSHSHERSGVSKDPEPHHRQAAPKTNPSHRVGGGSLVNVSGSGKASTITRRNRKSSVYLGFDSSAGGAGEAETRL